MTPEENKHYQRGWEAGRRKGRRERTWRAGAALADVLDHVPLPSLLEAIDRRRAEAARIDRIRLLTRHGLERIATLYGLDSVPLHCEQHQRLGVQAGLARALLLETLYDLGFSYTEISHALNLSASKASTQHRCRCLLLDGHKPTLVNLHHLRRHLLKQLDPTTRKSFPASRYP